MTKSQKLLIGREYLHDFMDKTWRIRVTGIDNKKPPERPEWTGVLSGAQHGLQDGDPCWGYISDLRGGE